jgi:hypothetical protein
MIVYPASKSRHWAFWQALRAAGVDIRASWVDWDHNHADSEPTDAEWRDHWEQCVREASEADVVLVYARSDERQNGALIEMGAGLAAGKQVFLVADYDWSVAHHPRCRRFKTLADATAAILALQAGENAEVVPIRKARSRES